MEASIFKRFLILTLLIPLFCACGGSTEESSGEGTPSGQVDVATDGSSTNDPAIFPGDTGGTPSEVTSSGGSSVSGGASSASGGGTTTSGSSTSGTSGNSTGTVSGGSVSGGTIAGSNTGGTASTGSSGSGGSSTAGVSSAGGSSGGITSSGTSAGVSSGGGTTGGVAAGGVLSVPIDTISYSLTFPASSVGWFTTRLRIGSVDRIVRLYRPNLDPNLPLLLIFSGTGGRPIDNFISELGNYRGDAESLIANTINHYETAILAFPEPRDLSIGDWDHEYGAPYWETSGQADSIDSNADLLFVRSIIQEARTRYQVNPRRVYSLGYSSGAFFSSLVAMRLSDRIAAFSEQSGGWVQCPPKQNWIPSPRSTDWTGLFLAGNTARPSFRACASGLAEPFASLPSSRRLPAYLRHGNADNVVSVYYSTALAEFMRIGGSSITPYSTGMDLASPEIVVEIVDGLEHSIGTDYLDRAWPFLRTKSLP